MLEFLFHLSDVTVFALLSILFIIFSVVAIILIKRHVPLKLRYKDNATIGITSSLISIIYGVLAGLMALYQINNLNYTADAVQQEANGVANLYRNSHWLQTDARANFQKTLLNYLEVVINKEWIQMQNAERVTSEGEILIDKLNEELIKYNVSSEKDKIIIPNILDEIRHLYDAREARIKMSKAKLSSEIWIVMLIGTALIIGINFLFGMNFYLHLVNVISVALMASATIFLLITLDRPFQGEFMVKPDALKSVENYILKHGTQLEMNG